MVYVNWQGRKEGGVELFILSIFRFESLAGDVMTLPYIIVFEYAVSNQKQNICLE